MRNETPDPMRWTELARRLGLVFWALFFFLALTKLGLLFRGDGPGQEVTGEGQVFVLELVRTLLIILTAGLLVYSYHARTPPQVRAVGLAERYYPLLITVLAFGFFAFHTPPPPIWIYMGGIGLCILGWTITLWSFWHLSKSFSIMAEVRKLVTAGPYRFVRHPLYLGEMINWAGLAVLYAGVPVAVYTMVLIVLQILRARVEEGKLVGALGQNYEAYRQKTGFLIPGFRG